MIRRRVHEILEPARPGDRVSSAFDVFIVCLIGLNVLAMILESMPSLRSWEGSFQVFEYASVAVFCVEYLLRLWSAPEDSRYRGAVRGRWKFAMTPLAVVDLAAILPSLTPALGFDLRFLRALRLFRVLRLGKLFRYSESLHLLGRVIRREREPLLMTLVILALLLLMSSIAMYFAEREAQPLMFSSVPATMWWSLGTVTAVGAGGMEPVTTLGRLLGVFIGFLGIASVALPTGILGAGFVEVFEDRRQRPRCPRCDAEIH